MNPQEPDAGSAIDARKRLAALSGLNIGLG